MLAFTSKDGLTLFKRQVSLPAAFATAIGAVREA